jgi:hypothetical protein
MKKQAERWRVEPGDAIGIGIRIPVDKIDLALNLVKPTVKRSDITPPDNTPTFYLTVGKGVLNGRNTSHKFLNVLCDPPPWVSASPAIGSLAWIGAQSSPPYRLLWRHGFKKGPAHITLTVSNDHLSARARIGANGYSLLVEATFPREGEYWESLPMHYCGMDPKTRRVIKGDEWGVRHDGTGLVSIKKVNGKTASFETYVGLDTQLGWDYILRPTDMEIN